MVNIWGCTLISKRPLREVTNRGSETIMSNTTVFVVGCAIYRFSFVYNCVELAPKTITTCLLLFALFENNALVFTKKMINIAHKISRKKKLSRIFFHFSCFSHEPLKRILC